MNRLTAAALAFTFVWCLGIATSEVHPARDTQGDAEGVQEALEGFHAALNRLFEGDAEPMSAVWSHSDDVTYMGPDGGFQVGWDDVEAEWKKQAALDLGGAVQPDEVHVHVGADLAVTHNFEVGENTDADGNPVKVRIRATNIFRKESGEWKMIGHHTDLLPFLSE